VKSEERIENDTKKIAKLASEKENIKLQ